MRRCEHERRIAAFTASVIDLLMHEITIYLATGCLVAELIAEDEAAEGHVD